MSAVLIRADGGATIGGGHIVRAGVLAGALSRDGCETHLLAKEDDWTRRAVESFSAKVHFFRMTDNESLVVSKTVKRLNAELLILDVQDTSEEYIRYLQECDIPVVTIDDRGRGAHLADATFCAGRPARRGGRPYDGPDYAMLTTEILERRKNARAPSGLDSCVIFFGTFDLRKYRKMIPDIASQFPAVSFRMYGGEEAAMTLPNVQTMSPDRARFLSDLASADLALVSGGVAMYEAAALGRPSIVFPQAPHEIEQATALAEKNAVMLVTEPSPDRIVSVIRALESRPEKLAALSRNAMAAVDGQGLERVMDVLRDLLRQGPRAA